TVRAQSCRVPTPLPDNPYVAVRQAHLVDTDTESGPVKDLRETEFEPEEAPSETKKFEASEPLDTRITSSHSSNSLDSNAPLSPDHPLTQTSPAPTATPIPTRVSLHRKTIHIADESSNSNTEREDLEDEGHGSEDEGPGSKEDEEEEDEAAPEDEPLGLGYRALRRHELVVGEGEMPSTFETPPCLEWSSGSLLVSTSSPVVPTLVASLVTTPAATIALEGDEFLEITDEMRERLELTDRVARMKRKHESREEW
nr:hypothetical protein [Tanacetum cinerariifolium]